MRGIVLAGGHGTRLAPSTQATSKHLFPVYDKPLVYYPIATLMLTGIREILVIATPRDLPRYRSALGDGTRLGIALSYAAQERPNGLAEALTIGAGFVGDDDVALILGDNVFHGPELADLLRAQAGHLDGCVLFGSPVADPRRYGVAEVDASGRLVSIEEKPERPRSRTAVTGLYLYDNDVLDIAARVRPSDRGELEITDVNRAYVARGRARLVDLGSDVAWLDAGTEDSLLEAATLVRDVHRREGVRVACLEETALRMGFIDAEACLDLGAGLGACPYGEYVRRVGLRALSQRRRPAGTTWSRAG
ncbi:glucose-1-phosphate thymidylyltransferase [Nocardiopsis sp. CNR-923]|uniref:glucose-1-phosphate thymidylyltransferase RfbA n=1 Tax=Nocardiopsis sp. CNR-923 TaxID=1904965 RepID=UPI000967BF3B|nr:glucose-1-phosphate thymidylyltransferase RfbA [Nocardiopsis sp. CNR-923]OLT29942.1 glucose-1-phosphate thymidylyltransferase [Nocardiopsis sp. CNR-923]